MTRFTVLDILALELQEPNNLDLSCISGRKGLENVIYSSEVSEPGLALIGYFEHFVGERIQIIGSSELSYIRSVGPEKLRVNIQRLFQNNIPCLVCCDNMRPSPLMVEEAENAHIPLLMTPHSKSATLIKLMRALDNVFAPAKTIHAVLVEVSGMGVLIQGESGVGKSEIALELLDRGHKLVADDSVFVKCLNGDYLFGQSSNLDMAKLMEIRGLGIIDVENVYGVSSMRSRKQIEMVIQLEEWDTDKDYDRLGTGFETTKLLGVDLPYIVIPVKPGRSISIIIEAAVRNRGYIVKDEQT